MKPVLVTETAHAVEAARTQRIALGLNHLELDDLAGLADGHTSKIECFDRTWGKKAFFMSFTFDYMLQALGLAMVVMPRDQALEFVNGSSERRITMRETAGGAQPVAKRINLVLSYRTGA